MKKFVSRSALAVCATVVLSMVITATTYAVVGERPVTEVESPFMIAKENRVRADDGFNTIFVGSSIMFRQIDPVVFDSAANTTDRFRSYNLGNPGLYPMRSVSYLEHLVDNPPPGVRYIVCELFRLDTVTYNFKAPEIMRLMTWSGYVDTLRTIASANFPRNYKFYLAGQYTRAAAFRLMGFGMLDYLGMERAMRPIDDERLGFSTRGFLAKDVEIALSADPENVAHISEVGEVLALQPDLLAPRVQIHREKYARSWQLESSPYIRKLLELIEKADSKGIRLIYVLPPLMTQRGIYFAYPAFLQLPEENRIDLSDPEKFPEIYSLENVFDLEHVNSKGSVFLSRYLARALSSLEDSRAGVETVID